MSRKQRCVIKNKAFCGHVKEVPSNILPPKLNLEYGQRSKRIFEGRHVYVGRKRWLVVDHVGHFSAQNDKLGWKGSQRLPARV